MFVENLRYEYDLNPDSYVIDVGGYEGRFASLFFQGYGCKIDVYEPISSFYSDCVKNLQAYPIKVIHSGIGGSERIETFHHETDRTGVFAQGNSEEVPIKDIKDILEGKKVDLIKINIEGMEYELLERVIECNLQGQLKNIQVQFHRIGENYDERYQKIREKLLETHELTYDYPFVWMNFRLKEESVV
jgi:FkbM family methyltransferase